MTPPGSAQAEPKGARVRYAERLRLLDGLQRTRQDGTLGEPIQRVLRPVIRQAVGPNRTASYLPVTLAVMRRSGDQMRLANLLGGSLDRRVDRGKVRHIPRGLSGLPEFALLPGKSGEGMIRR